jgi:O-antigen biosynthesis protein
MLMDTVDSIFRGNVVPAELIVIDQSDKPAYLEPALRHVAGNCSVKYRWSQSTGVSRARNEGIALAQCDIVAFTDDDVLASVDWFGELVQVAQEAGSGCVVTGRVLPTPTELSGRFAPATRVSNAPKVYKGRIGKNVLFPNNMAVYRSALERMNGFDERLGPGTAFPAAEDNDLGFRLLEAGYQIVYAPAAVVYHRAWRTDREFVPLRWCYGVGQGGFYAKHMSLHDRHILSWLGSDIGRHMRRVPQRVYWYDRRGLCGDLAYVGGIFYGVMRWAVRETRQH